MPEKPQTTWSPWKALRQRDDSSKTLARLGAAEDEEPPADYANQVQELRAEQDAANRSLLKQAAVYLPALAITCALIVAGVRRAIAPDFNLDPEIAALLEVADRDKILQAGEPHISPADAANRKALIRKDERNMSLLLKIEPNWRQIIDGWINTIPKNLTYRDYAKILFGFFIEHGLPLAYTSEITDEKAAHFDDTDDFTYDYLYGDRIGNDKKLWFSTHGIPYYDPESRTLFITDPTADAAPSKNRDAFILQMMDILIALHDAKSERKTGEVAYADVTLHRLLTFAHKIIPLPSALMKERLNTAKTAEEIKDILYKTASVLLNQEKTDTNSVAYKIAHTRMMYRMARLLLARSPIVQLSPFAINTLTSFARNPLQLGSESPEQLQSQAIEEASKLSEDAQTMVYYNIATVVEPEWQKTVEQMLDIKRGNNDTDGYEALQKLFNFYKAHKTFKVTDPITHERGAATQDQHAIFVETLDYASAKTPRHEWFKKHKMSFYDPASRSIFVETIQAEGEGSEPKKVEGTNMLDLVFTLADAYSHTHDGKVTLNHELARRAIDASSISMVTSFPQIDHMLEQLKEAKDPLKFVLGALGRWTHQAVQTIHPQADAPTKARFAYRFARLIAVSGDPRFSALQPYLMQIVEKPSLIDQIEWPQ